MFILPLNKIAARNMLAVFAVNGQVNSVLFKISFVLLRNRTFQREWALTPFILRRRDSDSIKKEHTVACWRDLFVMALYDDLFRQLICVSYVYTYIHIRVHTQLLVRSQYIVT
jgi:hypothetical protein